MSDYDRYYESKDLFGAPFDNLIEFFSSFKGTGKVLDLGCGQGRNAVPMARLGFDVTGVDLSAVGIEQMLTVAHQMNLNIGGEVADIHEYPHIQNFDFILFDSMFHFYKNDLQKERALIVRVVSEMKKGSRLIFCQLDSGNKVKILKETIGTSLTMITDEQMVYEFHEADSGHSSVSNYRLLVFTK